MYVSFSSCGIQSHCAFPAGNGFRAKHHSAHTEMIAHEQKKKACLVWFLMKACGSLVEALLRTAASFGSKWNSVWMCRFSGSGIRSFISFPVGNGS